MPRSDGTLGDISTQQLELLNYCLLPSSHSPTHPHNEMMIFASLAEFNKLKINFAPFMSLLCQSPDRSLLVSPAYGDTSSSSYRQIIWDTIDCGRWVARMWFPSYDKLVSLESLLFGWWVTLLWWLRSSFDIFWIGRGGINCTRTSVRGPHKGRRWQKTPKGIICSWQKLSRQIPGVSRVLSLRIATLGYRENIIFSHTSHTASGSARILCCSLPRPPIMQIFSLAQIFGKWHTDICYVTRSYLPCVCEVLWLPHDDL